MIQTLNWRVLIILRLSLLGNAEIVTDFLVTDFLVTAGRVRFPHQCVSQWLFRRRLKSCLFWHDSAAQFCDFAPHSCLLTETAISGVHNWVQCFAGEVSPHLLNGTVVASGDGWRSHRSLRRVRPAPPGLPPWRAEPLRRRLSGLPGLILKSLHVGFTDSVSGRDAAEKAMVTTLPEPSLRQSPWKGRLSSFNHPPGECACVCQSVVPGNWVWLKAAGQSPTESVRRPCRPVWVPPPI